MRIRCCLLSIIRVLSDVSFFFFNDTATTEIYTLSLHDALPISIIHCATCGEVPVPEDQLPVVLPEVENYQERRSEEHTSELQSHLNLVCRLLLEKKKKNNSIAATS